MTGTLARTMAGLLTLAASVWTPLDTLNALEDASPLARCVVHYETGGTYRTDLVGAQGELGPVQLHPQGELRRFMKTFDDPDPTNPWQAVYYLEMRIAEGAARAWSPVLRGLC